MHGNCRLLASENHEHPVEFTASPLRSTEGTLFGILYVLRITGEKERIQARVLRELDSLSRLQKRALPPRGIVVPGLQVEWIFLPGSFGGGDAIGCIQLDEGHVGFYTLDVLGGGLLSAMFSLLVATFLTPHFERGGILVEKLCEQPGSRVLTPAEVVKVLSTRFFQKDDATPYLSFAYGVLETSKGSLTLAHAGTPEPIVQGADGSMRLLKMESQAVGLFPGAEVPVESLSLVKNERLFLYSDGLAKCTNQVGETFSSERLVQVISASRRKTLKDAVKDIREEVTTWRGNGPFSDDVSLLALEWG